MVSVTSIVFSLSTNAADSLHILSTESRKGTSNRLLKSLSPLNGLTQDRGGGIESGRKTDSENS